MTHDIIVIGGGIAGISAAARLSCDAKVLVLEGEDHLAYHTSGRSAALYEENYGSPSTVALAKASSVDFKGRFKDVLSPRGFMLLCHRDENAQFEADLAHMGLSEITLDHAQSLVPILDQNTVTRAAVSNTAQDIDTDLMIQMFAKELRQNSGEIKTGHRVSGIAKSSGIWRITTSAGVLSAPILVNAAGAWGDEIAQMAGIAPLGLTPLRRSVARIAAPQNRDVSNWPVLFGPGERWYAKPDAGALIVSLAEETPSPPMDAWADDMDLAEALSRYQDYVTAPVTRPISSWAGLRTFAPDRNLVLGPAPIDNSFIWCVGQGGYGFFTAPAASQLIADLTFGNPPKIAPEHITSLSPARFT